MKRFIQYSYVQRNDDSDEPEDELIPYSTDSSILQSFNPLIPQFLNHWILTPDTRNLKPILY